MSFLQLQRVTRRFDNGSEGLSDVTLDIEQGSMVFLTGHSGAGKSTLLKLLGKRTTLASKRHHSQRILLILEGIKYTGKNTT